jgi:hypothetical protein
MSASVETKTLPRDVANPAFNALDLDQGKLVLV